MRYFIILVLLFVTITLAFDIQPVDIDRHVELTPPIVATIESADSNILEANLPRHVITFDFPHGYLDSNNLIMEAILKIHVEPFEIDGYEGIENRPIEAVCVPLTTSPGLSPTWTSLSSAYNMDYAEYTLYNEEERILFFEIARMLYAAVEGELDFHGILIIPAKGSPAFRLIDMPSPIDFSVANYEGARTIDD